MGSNAATSLMNVGDVFARQREALAAWKAQNHSRIFSFESSQLSKGSRQYLVINLESFWTWYIRATERHIYEVIPEDTPCRLYFDLEFYRECNAGLNELNVLQEFCDACVEVLSEHFVLSESVSAERSFHILDSSNTEKFSAHMTVHLPNDALFPSNTAMKSFVEKLCRCLIESGRSLVFNKSGDCVPLCDMAVYSKNRCFRIYLSSKAGKDTHLNLAPYCRFYSTDDTSQKQMFLDSLVVPEHFNTHPLVISQGSVSTSLSCFVSGAVSTNCWGSNDAESPFPMVEDFILEINRKFKSTVRIRSWRVSPQTELIGPQLFYQLHGSRYCFNIGREHRSNHVYWVVNIQKFNCYQKCFDPDCAGFKSYQFALPYFARRELEEKKRYYENIGVSNTNDSSEASKYSPTEEYDSFYDTEFDKQLAPSPVNQHEDSFYDPSTDSIFLK
ncbi:hypothetical protein QR680_002422 [Steinernema hermaphroditum]|uniref:DNA-directed primase/polymerase protein n=1 Tax=Steinernema hermaphroditum TaxID=289476 RepID=A0AA39LHP4_9BILA|nr:hypothetical protein QR680_002422 [Steinernema hermaphroditum]